MMWPNCLSVDRPIGRRLRAEAGAGCCGEAYSLWTCATTGYLVVIFFRRLRWSSNMLPLVVATSSIWPWRSHSVTRLSLLEQIAMSLCTVHGACVVRGRVRPFLN
jgi:hypothetical protein